MLVKGHIIHQDFQKAKSILLENRQIDPIQSIILNGYISRKQKNYSEAKKKNFF